MERRDLAILLLIIAFGIVLRSIFIIHTGASWYEPDNAYYYSIMRQTVANAYHIPSFDKFSGFPIHNPYSEQVGLIYLAVIPFYLLGWTGLGLITIMHLMILLFAVLGILICYKFAYELSSGNQPTALLSAFFFATIPAAIFKTMAGEWRGDSFVPIMFGAALLLLLLAYKRKDKISIIYIILSILIMVGAYYTWTGALYALAGYILVLVILGFYFLVQHLFNFEDTRKPVLITGVAATLGLILLWFIFIHVLASANAPNIQLSTILHIGGFFNNQESRIAQTTSELASPTLLFWITNYLFAFFLMWFVIIGYLFHHRDGTQRVAYLILLGLLLIGIPEAMTQTRWGFLIAIPVAVFASLFIKLLYEYKEKFAISDRKINQLFLLIIAVSVAVPIYQFFPLSSPAGISPQYEQTILWIRNNTPSNSTFLTEWSDGSALEAWGNRTSYTDSVGGENYTHIVGFQDFLFEPAGNFSYLAQIHPNYLLTRKYWLTLSNAIAYQGNLSYNAPTLGTNLELLVNETPNTISSSNKTIVLTKIYQDYNNTLYQVVYNYQLPTNYSIATTCITVECISSNGIAANEVTTNAI